MASMANATRDGRINRIKKYEADLKRLEEDIANQEAVNERLMARLVKAQNESPLNNPQHQAALLLQKILDAEKNAANETVSNISVLKSSTVLLHTGRQLIPEYFCLIPEYVVLKEE